MKGKSNVENSPVFGEIMARFDEMRRETGSGKVNYRQLYVFAKKLDPTISYAGVMRFFKRFTNSYLVQKEIAREDLRIRKKRISAEALKEVEENPKKLTVLQRIMLGESATREELKEIDMSHRHKHLDKQEDFLSQILNQARYGDVIDAEFEDRGDGVLDAGADGEAPHALPGAAEERL